MPQVVALVDAEYEERLSPNVLGLRPSLASRWLLVKAGLLAVFSGLVLAAPVSAESRIGLFGGVNLAWLHETPSVIGSYWPLARLEGGVIVDVGLGGRLSLRFEPMLLGKGGNYFCEACPPPPTLALIQDFRFSYVELPVLMRLSFGTSSVGPYLVAGPAVSYLTKAGVRANKTDVGMSFGGGVAVSAGRALPFIEIRYSRGFRSVLKDLPEFALKNVGVQLAAGVTFSLGHR